VNPLTLKRISEPLVDVYIGIENDLMQNVTKHLASGTAVGTTEWNMGKLQELNALKQESYDILVKGMKGIDYDLYQILKEASEINLTATNRILQESVRKGLIEESIFSGNNPVIAHIFDAYYADAKNKFNLINSTMLHDTGMKYIGVLNKTTGKVLTGVATPPRSFTAEYKGVCGRGYPGVD
jgi:hypothetical protein